MEKWDAETRQLSRKLLREIVRLGKPDQQWEVSRGTASEAMGIEDPDDLFRVAQLLTEEGMATSSGTSLWLLKPTPSGRRLASRA